MLILSRPGGVEPPTFGFGSQHSIQLSYGRKMCKIVIYYYIAAVSTTRSITVLGLGAKKLCKILLFISVATPLAALAALSGSLSQDAINERLKPEGQVNILMEEGNESANASSAHTDSKSAKSIYDKNCKLCHASGLAGAPKFRVKKDWTARIAQGLDTMTTKAVQGFKAMPPKGNCLDCNDADIRKTIEYMIETIN